MLSNAKKDQIVLLKEVEHKNNTEIARLVGVNRGTVIKVLKSGHNVNQQFIDKYNQNNKENNDKLLDMIKSVRYNDIVKNVLSLFTLENMKLEFSERGMRSLIALQGNMFDKGMAYERLELDKRKTTIAERTLELKEQELQARIDNPDAFSNIVIIDDSDKAAEYYKHNEDEYGKHTN